MDTTFVGSKTLLSTNKTSKTAQCIEVTHGLSDSILHKHTPKIPHTLIIQYHSLSYDYKFKSTNPRIG